MPTRNLIVVADSVSPRRQNTATALADAGYVVREAIDAAAVKTLVEAESPSAVLVDALLPGGAAELLTALRTNPESAAVRILVVIDPQDQTTTARARLASADACLVRPIEMRSIIACLTTLEAETELVSRGDDDGADLAGFFESVDARAARETPLLAALTDSVTGLWNEAYTALKLGEEFKKARRFQTPLAAMVVATDIPFPNTSKGRADRRRLMSDLSGLLLCESRDVDHLARLDDDRFLALLPHTNEQGAAAMAVRVAQSIERRAFRVPHHGAPVTISAGVAAYNGAEMASGEELVLRATEALDASRRQGVSRVTTWAPEPAQTEG